MKYYKGIIALAFLLLTACGEKIENAEKESTVQTTLQEEQAEVTVVKLEKKSFNHELISNGKLSARKMADLYFKSPEVIASIAVRNGDVVKKGQTIAVLDKFTLSNRTTSAKNNLEKAELDLQDVLIGQGYPLKDSINVPEKIMKLAKIKSGYNQYLSQYELAKYEEQQARLIAPFDGIVANLFDVAFNQSSTSKPFCRIIDPNSLEASFTILESELSLVHRGDKVEITPFTQAGDKTMGSITEINPLVDEKGMIQLKASVSSSRQFVEGMNVRVSILKALKNQWVVPKTAVVLRSGRSVVFTLKDGKAYWNYVTVGLENMENCTITGENIQENDTIIVTGNINLAHETPVKIVE